MTPAAASLPQSMCLPISTPSSPGSRSPEGLGPRSSLRRSGDRAAIAGLVYDALRMRASSAFIMREETPRAILLGALRRARALPIESIAALCSGDRYAPAPLSVSEGLRLPRTIYPALRPCAG